MAKQPKIWNPKPHRAVDKPIEKLAGKHLAIGVKVDGIRALYFHETYLDDTYRLTTRSGIEIKCLNTAYWQTYIATHLADSGILVNPGKCLDMELWIYGVDFDTTSGLLRQHTELDHSYDLRMTLIDRGYTEMFVKNLPQAGGLRSLGYGDRAHNYFCHLPSPATAYKVSYDYISQCLGEVDVINSFYDLVRQAGFEGLVLKEMDAPMKNGKVTGWYKFKPSITVDGIICGFVYGEKGKANEGKIVGFEVRLEEEDGGEVIRATGLTQENIQRVTDDVHLNNSSKKYLGRYVEVSAMERTPQGKLRHPKFKAYRDLNYAPGEKL